MLSIIFFIIFIILLLYIYAKIYENDILKDEIKQLQYKKKHISKKTLTSEPTCPDPTGNNRAKCWYHPKFDIWKCQYMGDDGVRYDADKSCCNPDCDQVKQISKKFFKKDTIPPVPLKHSPLGDSVTRSYWCFDNNKNICYSKAYNYSDYSQNRCPSITASNMPGKNYSSEEQCFNNNLAWKDYNMKSCLSRTGFGWCTDSKGVGTCVKGTPVGPNDPEKYDCMPGEGGDIQPNMYIYGETDPFIKDSMKK